MRLDTLREVHEHLANKDLVRDGQCYHANAEAQELLAFRDIGALLVHGNPRYEGWGRRFGHAWVEIKGMAIDFSYENIVPWPADFYYAQGHITVVRKYTYREAQKLISKRKNWGYWDEVFDDLVFVDNRTKKCAQK